MSGSRPRGPMPHTRWHDMADAYRIRSGRRLAAARVSARLTTIQLAKAIGITDGTVISGYELDGALPAPERMFQLAEALDTTVDAIWGFGDEP